VFEKELLILLWMAENFLQCPRQPMSMEEVGEQYFNDLFSRSFFKEYSREYGMHFIMHDLLNDLAKYVCGDFCFTIKHKESHHISEITRHLSILGNPCKSLKILHKANRLHTFLPLTMTPYGYVSNEWTSNTLIQELFSKCKLFRVLSLSGCVFVKEFPDTIGNLKHLCYLDHKLHHFHGGR
jgi:hypothetical protein